MYTYETTAVPAAQRAAHEAKKYRTKSDLLYSGKILEEYGKNYMITVTPNFDINGSTFNKVRISLVKLGTGGKDYADFYADLDDFRRLCKEILNGKAFKKIEADQVNQYPGAYKYVSGENGEKHLNIGHGKIGVRVQIQIGKDSRIMAVSPSALEDMAFYFNLVSGLTPAGRYYKHLADMFWKGVSDRRNRY